MNIAFQAFRGDYWLGGVTTLRDLLIALKRLGSEAPTLTLLIWEGTPEADYGAFQPFADRVIRVPFDRAPVAAPVPAQQPGLLGKLSRRWHRAVGRPVHSVASPPTGPEGLRAYGIDCTFSVILDGHNDTSVPLILWLYDFQHRHLPHFFSEAEKRTRDRSFQREGRLASLLLVQSDSVGQDVAQSMPELAAKTRRLRWVADIPAAIYARHPSEVLTTYHLPEKFFYLPNQLWMHKNHVTVFKALRLLHARGLRPVIVCSGSLIDNRRPDYINELAQTLSLEDLRDQVIFLGVIPREHVLLLMRQSVRVINASLFEGFGLSVAECISLGKGLVLSDLPVLREQAPPVCHYFDPHDETALANALADIWTTTAPGPDYQLEAEARAALPARQAEFGRAFVQIAAEAVALGQPNQPVAPPAS